VFDRVFPGVFDRVFPGVFDRVFPGVFDRVFPGVFRCLILAPAPSYFLLWYVGFFFQFVYFFACHIFGIVKPYSRHCCSEYRRQNDVGGAVHGAFMRSHVPGV
jgi:hypothetical protein